MRRRSRSRSRRELNLVSIKLQCQFSILQEEPNKLKFTKANNRKIQPDIPENKAIQKNGNSKLYSQNEWEYVIVFPKRLGIVNCIPKMNGNSKLYFQKE